jgi:hypothetical protein
MKWNWLPNSDISTRDVWHAQRVGVMDSTTYLLDQSRVLYVFRGSAGASGLISTPGFSSDLFQDDALYARTVDGLWKIRWKAWLTPHLFRHTHESLFVNSRRHPSLVIDELERKWYRFTFADGHDELAPISRALYSAMRAEYRGEEPSRDDSQPRRAARSFRRKGGKTPAPTPKSTERATLFDGPSPGLVKNKRARNDSESQSS